MNICFIGASGHSSAVVESGRLRDKKDEKDKSVTVAGIAAGSEGENIEGLYKYLCNSGHSPKKYDGWDSSTGYIKMMEELKPDIVIVDNYYGDHAKVSIEALRRGCHVFADKPLAVTLDSLHELKKEYNKSGKKIAAMFTMRFEPAYRAAYEIVKRGEIGDIRIINAQKSYKLGTRPDFYKSRESFGGLIPWVGIHAIDLIYMFGGKKFIYTDASCSSAGNNNHGDLDITAAANFILEDNIISTMTVDYLRPSGASSHGDDRLRIVGSSGIVEVMKSKVILIDKDGEREISQADMPGNTDLFDIFTDFLDYVDGKENTILNAEDAFYITEISIKSQNSADKKKGDFNIK